MLKAASVMPILGSQDCPGAVLGVKPADRESVRMPQIFHPSANTLSRLTIFGAVGIVLGLIFS